MHKRKTPMAVLAASLTLAVLALGLGLDGAEAATTCKDRYRACMVRCPVYSNKCVNRCQSQYRHCIIPRPYLGDVL